MYCLWQHHPVSTVSNSPEIVELPQRELQKSKSSILKIVSMVTTYPKAANVFLSHTITSSVDTIEVPEVLEVQEVPSLEVIILPDEGEPPISTKVLFPKLRPLRL